MGLLSLILVGCARYNYRVSILNQTSEEIVVEPFQISDKAPTASLPAESAHHLGRRAMAPFLHAPNESVTIKWKSRRGEVTEVSVKLNPPKEFTKKNGTDIYFYIQSNQTVRVEYKIRD